MMKDVTITLPEDVARWLRIKAAENELSVSRWVAELLGGMWRQEDEYEIAMKRYLAMKPRKIDWPDGRRPSGRGCMIGPVFVDTNVFVYRHDDSVPSKQSRAEQWITLLVHSRQVVCARSSRMEASPQPTILTRSCKIRCETKVLSDQHGGGQGVRKSS